MNNKFLIAFLVVAVLVIAFVEVGGNGILKKKPTTPQAPSLPPTQTQPQQEEKPCNCPQFQTPRTKSAKAFIDSYNARSWIKLKIDFIKNELLKSGYNTGEMVIIDF